jgi:uncharacterized protein (TIGR00297 family)
VAVALVAYRAGSLSRSGVIAAVFVGGTAAMAGVGWAAFLIVYFILTSLLSRLGREAKQRALRGIVEKTGARDARQVAANGAVFGVAAIGFVLDPSHALRWESAAIGALSASASDTIATEIGTWLGGVPRSVRDWRPVPTGTSGAVSAAGLLGMIGGAMVVSALGVALLRPAAPLSPLLAWLALAGCTGAAIDTLVGATVQQRRRCPRCQLSTEQRLHSCGTPTDHVGGARWVENDAVNALCTAVGAIVGAAGGYLWS